MTARGISLLGDACRSLCTCGGQESDEGHTHWCKWTEALLAACGNIQKRSPPSFSDRDAVIEALEPFAKLDDVRELGGLVAGNEMPLHLGVMNGNVTQSVIRGWLRVGDIRRAANLYRSLKSPPTVG